MHCSLCTGLPPMLVEQPRLFFGVQFLSGLCAVVVLIAIEAN
jgi:hypothetical protein